MLVNTPDEYDYYELLDLAGELIKFYIKRIPINDEYDIATTIIVITDNIDEAENDNYLEFRTVSNDNKKINGFINNCNKLICSAKNHQSSNEKNECLLGRVKLNFYDNWLSYPHKFADDSIQIWFDFILDKIYNSKIIDINNITLDKNNIKKAPPVRIKPNVSALLKSLSSKYPQPQIRYIDIKEE